MADSDAPNDEDAPEGAGLDGESGQRRSTYTPPPAGIPPTFSLEDTLDVTGVPLAFNPPPFDDDDEPNELPSSAASFDPDDGSTVYSLDDATTGRATFTPPSSGTPSASEPPLPRFAPPAFSLDSATSWDPPPFDPPPAPHPIATDEQLAAAPPPVFERPFSSGPASDDDIAADDVVADDVVPDDLVPDDIVLDDGAAEDTAIIEPSAEEFDSAEETPLDALATDAEQAEPEAEYPDSDVSFPQPVESDVAEPEVAIDEDTAPPVLAPPPPWGAPSVQGTVFDTSSATEDSLPSAEEQARLLAQHAGPTSRPWIPERQSLTDEELAAGLTAELDGAESQPGAVLGAMEQLERQLWLRAEEAREYQDWEQSMLSIGTPEALAAVEEVRPQFSDVVATTTSIPIQYPEAPQTSEAPAEADSTEPSAAPELEDQPMAEPAIDMPAIVEPAVVEPAVDEPAIDEPAIDEPAVDEAAPLARVIEEPVSDEPGVPEDIENVSETETPDPAPESRPTPVVDEVEPSDAPVVPDFDPIDYSAFVAPAFIEPEDELASEQPSSDTRGSEQPTSDLPTIETPDAPIIPPFDSSEPFPFAPPALIEPTDIADLPSFVVPQLHDALDESVEADPQEPEATDETPVIPHFDPVDYSDSAPPMFDGSDDATVAEEPSPDPRDPFDFSGIPELVEPRPADEPLVIPAFDDVDYTAFESPDVDTADGAPVAEGPSADTPNPFDFSAPPALIEPTPFGNSATSIVPPTDSETDEGDEETQENQEPAEPSADQFDYSSFTPPAVVEPDPFDFTVIPSSPPVGTQPPALVEPPAPSNPDGEPRQVQVPFFEADASIDPFSDLPEQVDPEPVDPEPSASSPLFVEPELPAGGFSFDDLLAAEPEEAIDSEHVPDATVALPASDSATDSSTTPAIDSSAAVVTALGAEAHTATGTGTGTGTVEPVVAADGIAADGIAADGVAEADEAVPQAGRRAAIAAETATAAGESQDEPEQRGGAIRPLWLWFAANASVISVALGAVLFSRGMSLRQAVISTIIGLALSVIPLAVGTVASRRSALPTLVVSRATFGFHGNVLPAILAIVARVFWGAALLWVLGTSVASVLIGAKIAGGLTHDELALAVMGAGFVISLLIAFFGLRVIATFQLVVAVVSLVLIGGLIALTWQYVDVTKALSVQDGSISLLATGAVLVFSVVGLVWAMGAGDLALDRRGRGPRGGAAAFASLGAILPVVVLASYGALLAASNPALAKGLVSDPVDTIGRLLPLWYPIPLVAAVALGLLSGLVVLIASGSNALVGAGLRVSPAIGAAIVAVLVFAFGWLISTAGSSPQTLLLDLATTVAVPVAAFVGIFAIDVIIRRRSFDGPSLLAAGGVYPRARWANIVALVIVTAVGWGFTTASVTGLDWQGYLFSLIGVTGDVAATNLGVLVALVLGALISLGFGTREVRRQEALEAPL